MKASRREWVALAVLALPTLIVTMDLSVLFLAVPKLSADLQPSSSELLWISDIYGFLIAAALITMGNLGDRIGSRRLLFAGALAFAAASALAAFSTSATMLIAARAVLGLAAATLAPSSLALITKMFRDEGERQKAIAIWISCFAAGAAVGPLVGGALLEHFWWGSVFLINVPIMGLLLAIGPALLPESRQGRTGPVDPLSAAMSLAAVLLVIFGVTRLASGGDVAPALVTIGAGALIVPFFLRRQRRLAEPLIDLELFRSPRIASACAALLVSVFVVSGADLFVAQYLQLVHGSSPLVAGLWMLPEVVALIVGSMLAPKVASRLGPGRVVALSLGMAALGLLVLALLDPDSSLALIVLGTSLIGLGAGPVGTLGTDIVIGAASEDRAGAAAGVSETATELGGALGIAIMGAVGTAVYRGSVGDSGLGSLGTTAADSVRESFGGAVKALQTLGGADQVLESARESFTMGFGVAALVGAVVAAAAALLAAYFLRQPSA